MATRSATLSGSLLVAAAVLAAPAFRPPIVAHALPALSALQRSGLGRTPAPAALASIDIDVLPDGRGLPSGSGTASDGRAIYASRCASCHGASGAEGPDHVIAGGRGTLTTLRPMKTVGSYWPYATTLWDYINRAMPYDRPGALSANEVYAVTAFVLHLNGIVAEGDVLTERTLPQVKMPNRDGFVREVRP